MSGRHPNLRIVLETGKDKVFASAIDWPGWSRSGKNTADAAIGELLAYRTRYNAVLRLSHITAIPEPARVEVVETSTGDATTDFGAPSMPARVESEPLAGDELNRQLAILKASWRFLDKVASDVTPELRKGPRGGGRDRDKLLDHVIQADRGYARKIGVGTPPFNSLDDRAVQAHHEAVFETIADCRNAKPKTGKGWPVRYAIRRMAWHVLDHAWEMEDKDLTGKENS